jgi:hypothetical protein
MIKRSSNVIWQLVSIEICDACNTNLL